ncbi:DNA polymerase LigD, polymerase domain protein [Mycobacteroides abscessus subsp. abscessus]|uniref:DNA polymerase domain-containing protein n=1 Tax=Mycobacteroides abscessus TaxID=36809 RepID=UPI00092BEB85|nr:DNA primase small subunit domain-containing protein [Mycobacteroides abscessus]SHU63997.1 DNA polymerase LigD, polymerase domain protein [Mycobacteroides abscessus subsp. abscessus]
MARGNEVEVEVESSDMPTRVLRVSSASRVVFPATDITPAITKLELVRYLLTVGDPLLRVLAGRPTTLERWPGGVHPGMTLGHGAEAGGFYQKHMMRAAPSYVEGVYVTFPSKRVAKEVCPTELATLIWCAQMGTITFHPWPVRRTNNPHSLDNPDELRIDLDPQPGTTFDDVIRVALAARDLLQEFGMTSFCKTSGGRGVHVFVKINPVWDFLDVRHAAIAFGRELQRRDKGVTTEWWRELRGARIFIDYNQNCRDRTMASAWSPRSLPGAPVSTPVTWDELEKTRDPREFNLITVPTHLASRGDPWHSIDEVHHSLDHLLELWKSDPVEMSFPPDYPKMPGEPKRVQPSRDADRPR